MITTFDTEDLTAPEVMSDPYGYFGRLRDEDPVHWNPLHREWVVTGYNEVVWLVRQHEIFSNAFSPQGESPAELVPPIDAEDWGLAEYMNASFRPLLFHDRPEHLAMRQAIHRWFTPRAVEKWRLKLRGSAEDLIEQKLPEGNMEVKQDFAVWLPLITINLMLGIPQSDAIRLHALADSIVNVGFSPQRMGPVVDAWRELREYFAPLVEARMKEPGEDLLSILAEGERNGAYKRSECLATSVFLMIAGHATTMNLIANGLLTMLRNPDQWDILCEDPEGLSASATEECLRFEPSVKGSNRICVEDVVLGGKSISAGDRLFWVVSSANRDPAVFTDPEVFDIKRSPNPHIAFGGGIHHCLGAALARVEGQEAFRALAERLPRPRVADTSLDYLPNKLERELEALHVRWD